MSESGVSEPELIINYLLGLDLCRHLRLHKSARLSNEGRSQVVRTHTPYGVYVELLRSPLAVG